MAANTHLVSVTENMVLKEVRKKPSISGWFGQNWPAILAEAVSTFLLLLLGCMTCIPIDGFSINPPLYGPIGFGLIVLFNIQSFGHISGAHMNPIVSVTAIIWGNLSITLGIAYVFAQCAGAIIGYGMLFIFFSADLTTDGVCCTQPHDRYTVFQAVGIEIFLTAALTFINCAVWDPINGDKLESASIKIGLTIAGLSLAGGPLTGASMNPARSLGPAVWNNKWKAHWIYWVGPFVGGILAVLLYKSVWLKIRVDKVRKKETLTWTEEIKGSSRTGKRKEKRSRKLPALNHYSYPALNYYSYRSSIRRYTTMEPA